jgi:hypothetical protein
MVLIHYNVIDVQKPLCHLNPHKVTGPDQVSTRLHKETAKQISPALTLVFQASINQGKVPEEWKSANITPLFKKGDRSAPVNYRPVSLTSVCSKVMEHIIHSHIIKPNHQKAGYPITEEASELIML